MMWLHSRDLQHEHKSALHPLPLLQLQADVIDLVANHSESTCPHPPKMKLKCRGAGIVNATWFWIVKCSKMLRKSWLDWKDARLQGVQIKTDKSLTYILQAPSSHSVKDPSTSDVSIPMSLAFYCAITRLSQEDWKRVAPYGTAFAKGCLIFLIGVQLRRFLATFAGHWLGHYPYVDHGQNHNNDGNKIYSNNGHHHQNQHHNHDHNHNRSQYDIIEYGWMAPCYYGYHYECYCCHCGCDIMSWNESTFKNIFMMWLNSTFPFHNWYLESMPMTKTPLFSLQSRFSLHRSKLRRLGTLPHPAPSKRLHNPKHVSWTYLHVQPNAR